MNRNSRIPVSKWKPHAFFGLIEWKDGDSKKYSQSDMWTEKDILLAVQTCAHPRDKAVIALGYDVAGRPVELNNMKIRDVIFRDKYAQVKFEDHTGTRYPPLTFSYEYVLAWLNCHPLKDNPNAPLWVTIEGSMPRKPYPTWIYYLLKRNLKPKLKNSTKDCVELMVIIEGNTTQPVGLQCHTST